MARRLYRDEALAFVEELNRAEVEASDELSLQSLGDKRDAVLSMSPELRAFFDKEPKQFSSGL